jgi:hypothetical protein
MKETAMNAELESARDDLAFMRALVSDTGKFTVAGGQLFFWAGLLYGAQCMGHFLDIIGVLHLSPPGQLALGFGPTLVFLAIVCWVVWKQRGEKRGGAASRAMNAVFQGAGLANLVMACVFAYGADKTQLFTVWLYHPIVVCMFQGVAWYVAWTIQKRAWLGAVSFGWFATTIACGLLIDQVGYYLLTLGVALIVFMALPGYVMMRTAHAAP